MIKTLNKKEYENLLQNFKNYHFIQSTEHDYQEIMYGNCKYVGYFKKEKPIILFKYGTTQILRNRKIALGSFGPIINLKETTQKDFHLFLSELGELLKIQDIIFLQIYPALLQDNKELEELMINETLLRKSWRKFTWLDGTMFMEMDKTTEEMLSSFRKDVKYNIKKAEKNENLKINTYTKPTKEQQERFLNLYEKQQERKEFKDRAIKFYKDLFENEKAVLFEATDENEIVSAIMGVKFDSQKTLITYISASVKKAFKSKAPTLLRWELIKWAKENGYERVDFFSLDKDTPSVSNFKRGFRPTEIEFPEFAYDLILNKKVYNFYKIYRNLRK